MTAASVLVAEIAEALPVGEDQPTEDGESQAVENGRAQRRNSDEAARHQKHHSQGEQDSGTLPEPRASPPHCIARADNLIRSYRMISIKPAHFPRATLTSRF